MLLFWRNKYDEIQRQGENYIIWPANAWIVKIIDEEQCIANERSHEDAAPHFAMEARPVKEKCKYTPGHHTQAGGYPLANDQVDGYGEEHGDDHNHAKGVKYPVFEREDRRVAGKSQPLRTYFVTKR